VHRDHDVDAAVVVGRHWGRALKLTGAWEAGWLNLKTSRLMLEQRDMVNPLSEQTREGI